MSTNALSKKSLSWHPSPLIMASFALHIILFIGVCIAPMHWRWYLGLLVLNHLLLIGLSIWPRSQLLGSNWTRLPNHIQNAIAVTIDDGPHPEVTPKVLDILDAAKAKATFFCIGDEIERFPEICREIIRRGHSIENHSQHHQHHFAFSGIQGFTQELQAAQATITRHTGQAPLFFRAPAGMRNPLLDIVLQRMGLQLASWSRRAYDTRCTDVDKVLRKLLNNLKSGDILLLHDGNAAITPDGQPVILQVLPKLLQAASEEKLRLVTLRSCLSSH